MTLECVTHLVPRLIAPSKEETGSLYIESHPCQPNRKEGQLMLAKRSTRLTLNPKTRDNFNSKTSNVTDRESFRRAQNGKRIK